MVSCDVMCLGHMTKHVESHGYGKYTADLYASLLGGRLAERGNTREGGERGDRVQHLPKKAPSQTHIHTVYVPGLIP